VKEMKNKIKVIYPKDHNNVRKNVVDGSAIEPTPMEAKYTT
jgi:hypothetical protein